MLAYSTYTPPLASTTRRLPAAGPSRDKKGRRAMTAATVPPPSWIPIGAPEIRANTRRFFTRALAISAAGHLVVLAIVLWLRATSVDTEPRWILTPARFTPPPEILRPIPPRAPTSEPTPAKRTIDGSIDPTDVIVPDPPDATAGVKPAETGSKTNGTSTAPPSTG